MAVESVYGAAAREVCELFGDYLEGDAGRPALVIGSHACARAARDALSKSFEAFGYSSEACSFVSLVPLNVPDGEAAELELDAQALFLLVEGIDPLFIVAVDAAAASKIGEAYRTTLPLDAPARVFGRSSAVFEDFEASLSSDAGKQRVWKVLKSLQDPRG